MAVRIEKECNAKNISNCDNDVKTCCTVNIKSYKDKELNTIYESMKDLLKHSELPTTTIMRRSSELATYIAFKKKVLQTVPCDLIGYLQDAIDTINDIGMSDESDISWEQSQELEIELNRSLSIMIEEMLDGRGNINIEY